MMKRLLLVFLGILLPSLASAAASDYRKFFRVDLEQPLPMLAELKQKYQTEDIYDKHYDYSWNIGNRFDQAFRDIIKSYGTSEKRLKPEYEDRLLEMLAMMPKETYQYIGPYLHTVPGMSEKILNLPGIKETKNKFPERIDARFRNIAGLEFLSPSLYFTLMPEAWPENRKVIEKPIPTSRPPKAPYNEKFFDGLQKLVPPSAYNPQQAADKKSVRSSLRTIRPNADSLVTAADIRAVAATLPAIGKLGSDPYLQSDLFLAGRLLDKWENDNGQGIPLPILKDLVNPCSRLVQKFRLLGRENELSAIVAEQGFSTTEWGYTCDKAVRAYRTSQMSSSTAMALASYRRNLQKPFLKDLSPKLAEQQEIIMQSVIEMYNAPLSDTLEARKIRPELEKTFRQSGGQIIGVPIDIME